MMPDDIPEDWFEEHDGQRLVLDQKKIAAEITKLRLALAIADKGTAPELVWVSSDGRTHHAFASEEAANRYFAEHDPEGVAFQIEVEE